MRTFVFCVSIILLFTLTERCFGQEKIRHWAANGYVKDLQNIWMQEVDNPWLTWTTLHNRIDLKYFPYNNLTFGVSARNNLNFGELFTAYPGMAESAERDAGLFDMSWKIANGASYVLSTNIDRAFAEYSHNKLNLRVGRQRINWGIGLVWNPNDLFNTFSYFDFDYEERPGSDAIKLEYYTSFTSSAQLVAKLDSSHNATIAGMYRFNRWNYDFQLLAGTTGDDYVLGAGWAGQIEGGGFRGEASWFIPQHGSKQVLIATIDGDYSLKDGWYFHTAVLFNSAGTTGKAGAGGVLPEMDVSVKTLTRAKLSLLAQVSYPVSPLINAGVSAMKNPYDGSSFLGPSVDFSLAENASVMLFAQVFGGKEKTEFGDYGKLGYIRLKWSF